MPGVHKKKTCVTRILLGNSKRGVLFLANSYWNACYILPRSVAQATFSTGALAYVRLFLVHGANHILTRGAHSLYWMISGVSALAISEIVTMMIWMVKNLSNLIVNSKHLEGHYFQNLLKPWLRNHLAFKVNSKHLEGLYFQNFLQPWWRYPEKIVKMVRFKAF